MEGHGTDAIDVYLAHTGGVVKAGDHSKRRRRTRWPCSKDASGRRKAHGTILEIGSSMMSVAPASLRAGINVLIVSLGTTVSTA